MAKFLNTSQLITWIPKIIDDTERELIIITPFMQLSDKVYQHLLSANARGVETVIIYRENKLSERDRSRLAALDNLNLLHHPNVHAKCFYNETYLLIGSLNLYEYSEKNNREMSVLFSRRNISFKDDEDEIFNDALNEILEIQNGAEMEKPSRETIEEGFEMEILKTHKDKAIVNLKLFNKEFGHKRFDFDDTFHFSNFNSHTCAYICKSYFDKVDIKINYRIEFILNLDKIKLEKNYNLHKDLRKQLEYKFEGFKFYWNFPHLMFLYEDLKHSNWKQTNNSAQIQLKKRGIDEVVKFIKNMT